MNVEEILRGSVGVGEEGGGEIPSVGPNVTFGGCVAADDRRFSLGDEINQSLREELGSANITSTPERAIWPIYTKRRSGMFRELDEPPCEAVVLDVASGRGTVGCGELSRGNVINASEGGPRVL